jgi:DNA-binding response OmpR family regulator
LWQPDFQIDWVRDGEAAQPYAAAVLDLGVPRADGIDVPRSVRRTGVKLPIVVLTARHAVPDRIRGLNIGAAGLVKPIDLNEPGVRLRALLPITRKDSAKPINVRLIYDDHLWITEHVDRRWLALQANPCRPACAGPRGS